MKTNLTILTTIFFLLSAQYLIAQPSVSFYFTTAIPVNDYQQFDDDPGYGGNLEIFFISPSKQKPLGVGISLSYFGQGLYFYDDPCYCETYLSNNMANNFANAHLVFQLAPTGGTVRPYVETVFGGSYIYSNSQIFTPDYIPVSLFIDDWAWNYGIGGGLKFLLGADDMGGGSLYLDLKGRYLMSSDVSLLDRSSIRYANDRFYYSVNDTQLNFVAVQIGLVLYFR